MFEAEVDNLRRARKHLSDPSNWICNTLLVPREGGSAPMACAVGGLALAMGTYKHGEGYPPWNSVEMTALNAAAVSLFGMVIIDVNDRGLREHRRERVIQCYDAAICALEKAGEAGLSLAGLRKALLEQIPTTPPESSYRAGCCKEARALVQRMDVLANVTSLPLAPPLI